MLSWGSVVNSPATTNIPIRIKEQSKWSDQRQESGVGGRNFRVDRLRLVRSNLCFSVTLFSDERFRRFPTNGRT